MGNFHFISIFFLASLPVSSLTIVHIRHVILYSLHLVEIAS